MHGQAHQQSAVPQMWGLPALCTPTSPSWWAGKGWPWEKACGAQHCADHSSWAALVLSRPMSAGGGSKHVFCSGHNQWYVDVVSAQQRVGDGNGKVKRMPKESVMKAWNLQVWLFSNRTLSPPLHIPVAGQPGRDAFLPLQTMYLTLNHAIQVTVYEIQKAQVEKLVPHSAVGCHQRFSLVLVLFYFFSCPSN